LRYSDTVLLGYVNQTLKKMTMLRPDLFSVITDITTVANSVVQTLPPTSMRLVEIFQVKNGQSIQEVSRDVFDQVYPDWTNDAAGIPTKYMRHVRNPNSYFLYPRPMAGIVLVGEYVAFPPNYTLAQTITAVSDAYFPSLVDGTVFLAESVDNEYVNSGRAKLFFDSFVSGLGVSLQSRVITDTESSGVGTQQAGG
jgi:hypothetical protein